MRGRSGRGGVLSLAASWLVLLLGGAAGCGGDGGGAGTGPQPLPFLWGTATAGFQIDMGCPSSDCTDPHSDWFVWTHDRQVIADGYAAASCPRRDRATGSCTRRTWTSPATCSSP